MRRSPLSAALSAALALMVVGNVSAATVSIAAAPPSITAIDAARGNSNLVILRAGVFDPAAQTLDVRAVGAGTVASSDYAIVQFQPGKLAARKTLAAQGVEFLGYVPNNAYFVRLNGLSLDHAAHAAGVRWAGALQPALKLDPTLWQSNRPTSAAKQWDGTYEVQIDAFAGTAPDRIIAALLKTVPGVTITGRSERTGAEQYVRAAVSAGHLDALLAAATAIDGVEFVSPWIQARTTNSGAIGAIQGNATGSCPGNGTPCGPTPIWDHGLFGSGQIIAISDTGTDANEAWFTTLDKGAGPHTEVTFADNPAPVLPAIGTLYPNNKIIGYWVQPGATAYDNNSTCPGGNPSSYHGTHTSGTLVGDAAGTFGLTTYTASTPTSAGHDLADGMAPNAQLLQQDIGNDSSGCLAINDFRGTLQQAMAADAHIHSDSWGAADSGVYASDDNNVDYATNTLEDLLVVVAAGNSGPGATSIGSPGNAKNALTVGALGHAGSTTVASFSSRGPTTDGRFKPDIMAPGTSTVSAAGDSNTNATIQAPLMQTLSGTSMATPTIAGNAALMRQFFADGFYPRGVKTAADTYDPSGMAMKAFLLNGTNPLQSSSWPNDNIGWGRAWLDRNLWFAATLTGGDDTRRSRLFERTNAAGLKTGDENDYTIANVQAGAEFRATLTWFDPEASVGAASTLVNNLDLEVVGPGGTYLGNVFASGVSTTGGSADNKNTVEQVRLTAPTAGSYTLRVKGTSVPGNGRAQTDRQGYALVVSGKFGLPDAAASVAPTALNVASNDSNGVAIAFTAAGGAQGFQLYRANGTCASAKAGNFRLVANGAASPLVDDRTQGGFSYAYKVRGVSNDVEGDVSTCVDVVSQNSCTLQPTFDVNSLNANSANSTCSVALSWTAAQPQCPTSSGMTYSLQRSTSPDFTSAATIASGLTGASYTDTGVVDGQPYYYKVLAQDSFGNTAPASHLLNVTPSGADGPNPGVFFDNVDTHTYMTLQVPWQITGTSASDGSYSYHNAPDAQVYPDLTCASITTPKLTVPTGSTLSFMARYDMEYEWDGVVMEISTDGGSTWQDLPPDGGYPDSFALTGSPPVNACGFVTTHGAFTGVSTSGSNADPNNGTATAVFKPFTRDLTAYAGQTVQIRWRMSSDPASAYLGFLLDAVSIGNGVIFADGFETGAAFKDYTCH
ncbi:MAG TPA: S8 family serine peptidase [Rudaea sp.]